ncbi:sulfatase-like hydrolase/transferase, partial [Bacteroidota bacterium]
MSGPYPFFVFLFALGLLAFTGCGNDTDQPPNIILIVSDDQGYGDFGFTGNQYVSTPNLDHLKSESVYFDRFYVSPVCAPTRASLLTGRYHLRTGTSWVTHGKEIMRSEEFTIAESLKENGYVTACYGKWHNGEHYPHHPNGQGFDTFFGFCAGHWNNYFNTVL